MDPPRRVVLAILGGFALAIVLSVGVLFVHPAMAVGPMALNEPVANQTPPTAAPEINTAERLMLPPANLTTDAAQTSVDPARSTSVGFSRLAAEYDSHLLDARVDDAASAEAEVQVMRDEIAGLENELEEIHAAERAAHRAYLRGEIDGGEFLARLATVHERSLVLEYRLDHVSEMLRGITAPAVQDEVTGLSGRITQLSLELETFQGPLRAEAADGVRGGPGTDQPIVVQASADGHAIATIDRGIFTREVYVDPNRDRESRASFRDQQEGRERTAELYPWTFEQSIGTQGLLRGDIFRANMEHRHGTTATFIDGETRLPFNEIQALDLFRLPTATVLDATEDGYNLVVDATYAGGPARVDVTGPDGEPVDNATVSVDGHALTVTSDGEAWIVTTGESFELTLTTEESEIAIVVNVPVGDPTEA